MPRRGGFGGASRPLPGLVHQLLPPRQVGQARRPNCSRNFGVVPQRLGRPGISLRPRGAISPSSSSASSVRLRQAGAADLLDLGAG